MYYRVIKPEGDNWDKFAKIVFWRVSVTDARVGWACKAALDAVRRVAIESRS